jgi:hypothetical protein
MPEPFLVTLSSEKEEVELFDDDIITYNNKIK